MARVRRSSSPEIQLARLEEKHAKLDARVSELSSHSYLTPDQQMDVRRLKKEKLHTKELIEQYRS